MLDRSLTLITVFTLLTSLGCRDTIILGPTPQPTTEPTSRPSSSPTSTPTSSPIGSTTIEFRVTGNANSVRVRHSNSLDGLAQLTTTLPFFFQFKTNEPSIFLYLEATPLAYSAVVEHPFLSVQIFINGVLFREDTSSEFLLFPISVTGTYRR